MLCDCLLQVANIFPNEERVEIIEAVNEAATAAAGEGAELSPLELCVCPPLSFVFCLSMRALGRRVMYLSISLFWLILIVIITLAS